eukprot:1513000-Rhodomonas_salina.2
MFPTLFRVVIHHLLKDLADTAVRLAVHPQQGTARAHRLRSSAHRLRNPAEAGADTHRLEWINCSQWSQKRLHRLINVMLPRLVAPAAVSHAQRGLEIPRFQCGINLSSRELLGPADTGPEVTVSDTSFRGLEATGPTFGSDGDRTV